ncbi:MAG: SpoIVB peptidase [Clostridiales bacterium]|nr:SpoIVB peptidase [Clostridiales bacterium]
MRLKRLATRYIFLVLIVCAVALMCITPATNASALSKSVYPGGFPVAMILSIDGAVIDEVGFVKTAAGNATLSNKLRRGDTITEIDGSKVSNCDEIVDIIEGGEGAEITLTLIRGGKEVKIAVTPYIESDSGLYKLGVYIRDTISGVGTVTYIKENGFFGALGHKIVDSVAGCDIPISGGEIYGCDIIGVTKGKRNAPGEIRATLKGDAIGEVFSNTDFGVFGRFFNYTPTEDPAELGTKNEVMPGKAYILTSVGNGTNVYEVDIIRALGQSEASPKGILIRITDKRLLDISGGIVQGMSGSPLLLGGKIVGAVTHVLVNDPTKGYAIYIDWMQSA